MLLKRSSRHRIYFTKLVYIVAEKGNAIGVIHISRVDIDCIAFYSKRTAFEICRSPCVKYFDQFM